MFQTRLLSGIVLVAILLFLGIMGGDLLLAGLCITAEVGLYELYRTAGIEKSGLGYAGYMFALLYFFGLKLTGMFFSQGILLFPLAMALLVAVMAVYVFTYPKYQCRACGSASAVRTLLAQGAVRLWCGADRGTVPEMVPSGNDSGRD